MAEIKCDLHFFTRAKVNGCKWLIEHLKLDRFWTVERHIFRGRFPDAGGQVALFGTCWHFLAPCFLARTGSAGTEDGRWQWAENIHFRFSDSFALAWRRSLARVLEEICKPASGLRTGTNREPRITNRSEKIVDGFWEKRRGWGVFSFQLGRVARRRRRGKLF